tara:strand:+ start:690 stop:1172 length:483 start_codon:yes stop_codon:yes gene_type:complete
MLEQSVEINTSLTKLAVDTAASAGRVSAFAMKQCGDKDELRDQITVLQKRVRDLEDELREYRAGAEERSAKRRQLDTLVSPAAMFHDNDTDDCKTRRLKIIFDRSPAYVGIPKALYERAAKHLTTGRRCHQTANELFTAGMRAHTNDERMKKLRELYACL